MSKPSQVARMLHSCIEMKIPFYMAGAVGVGKSQVAKQVATSLGLDFTDVRLSQMDPTDIKGFPSPDARTKTMGWLPADFLPKKGKGLLFLDELVSAPTAVQAAS
jgi:MoxR-like ATPase